MSNRPRAIALDTSVVIRLLVQQPALLFDCAALFLEERLAANASVQVSDLVLAETYFALQSFYRVSKTDALQMLRAFVATPGIEVSPTARAVLSLPGLATANPGFVDRLIHGAAQSAGQTLVTFEKAARKLPATHVLEPSALTPS
ncbi:PIN domain-containing protein [uncultured Thiocystis sp.]|uniref:PIN domain-containing protein n=1 Tax=uncultured Thiocystis sp. TaxID=1202134 RepID=UPI0025DD4354|nr:PIN domain-containing protein [uncultured Thiocystis sp.]